MFVNKLILMFFNFLFVPFVTYNFLVILGVGSCGKNAGIREALLQTGASGRLRNLLYLQPDSDRDAARNHRRRARSACGADGNAPLVSLC